MGWCCRRLGIATDDVWQHPLLVARAIKKDFERIARQHNIKRVQTSVRQVFKHGIKFAEWLGLENEGLMKYFGFDGSHQYNMRGYFNELQTVLGAID